MKNSIFIHYIVPLFTFLSLVTSAQYSRLKLLFAVIAVTIIFLDTFLKMINK